MLSVAQSFINTSRKKSECTEIKPITVVFWTDFMNNPAVMYNLFAATPRKMDYDQDKVKVMGTKHGMINTINIRTVEDLDLIHEEIVGKPLLLRIFAEYSQQSSYYGAAQSETRWEGDLAMLVDTSHPMIRPEMERGLDAARKIVQSRGNFCLQIDFGPAIEKWLRATYPRACCTLTNVKSHKARLYITNSTKPQHCFDCNPLWWLFFGPCWLLSAPCYKLYRRAKCRDIVVQPVTNVVRRAVLQHGKVIEVVKLKDIQKEMWS